MTDDNPKPLQMLIDGSREQAAADFRALISAAIRAQPPGLLIRVSLVLAIIDDVSRLDEELDGMAGSEVAQMIRERIEEATR